jgi:hypothetical protein
MHGDTAGFEALDGALDEAQPRFDRAEMLLGVCGPAKIEIDQIRRYRVHVDGPVPHFPVEQLQSAYGGPFQRP